MRENKNINKKQTKQKKSYGETHGLDYRWFIAFTSPTNGDDLVIICPVAFWKPSYKPIRVHSALLPDLLVTQLLLFICLFVSVIASIKTVEPRELKF